MLARRSAVAVSRCPSRPCGPRRPAPRSPRGGGRRCRAARVRSGPARVATRVSTNSSCSASSSRVRSSSALTSRRRPPTSQPTHQGASVRKPISTFGNSEKPMATCAADREPDDREQPSPEGRMRAARVGEDEHHRGSGVGREVPFEVGDRGHQHAARRKRRRLRLDAGVSPRGLSRARRPATRQAPSGWHSGR